MTGEQAPDETVAGYRVVRRLGTGSRADVFLGAGTTGAVALKVFHADVPADNIGSELDALGRLDSPHIVRLLDVSSGPDDRPILILERLTGGSLIALLRDRDSLEKGEVATLLAPIASALPGMHRSGVAHQNIGLNTIYLGSAGQPVLLGFGHCELFASGGSIAAIEAEPAAARDRDGLAALTTTLLSHTRDAATDRDALALIEWVDSAPREFEFPERLESRLFELAEPIPVEFGRGGRMAPVVPARIAPPERMALVHAASERPPRESLRDAEPATEGQDGILGVAGRLLMENPIDAIRDRIIAAVKSVRKPFWFVAAAVVVAFVVVIATLPASSPRPAAVASTPRSAASAAPRPPAPTVPADPVLALPVLLTARSACIQAMSVQCLEDVDEASSSAYSQDAALIEQLQGGTEIPSTAIVTASEPSLIEMLGDSAIVSLGPNSKPASVLMIKDEAGWRIRGYLSGIQATGSPSTSSPSSGG